MPPVRTPDRDPLAVAFGRRLRDLRESQGLSRDALATLSGVSHRALDYLELGHRAPTLPTVMALADALGVTPGTLVDGLLDE